MKRTALVISLAAAAIIAVSCCQNKAPEKTGYTDQEAIENILQRKSVRAYTSQAVEQEKIDLMVKAGMAAPSAMDRRPWEIIIINDRAAMNTLAEALPYAKMLADAPMAIVVCGNVERSSQWYIDCSAVTQNILLAAEALGLGAVWTGAYPGEERVEAVSSVLGLPENIIPLNVIPVGYPDGDHQPKDKYDAAKVHYNKW